MLRRDWESGTDNTGCKDIARQLVEDRPGRHIDVSAGRLKVWLKVPEVRDVAWSVSSV